jgi:peptidoglycan-associated lipoprotein
MSGGSAAFTLVAGATLLSACASDADKKAPPLVNSQVGRSIVENPGEDIGRLLFAYDSAVIPQQYEYRLRRAADWLARYPSTKVTIEGHADERGTREYNLALGDRRPSR